jgi:hypothetical protein
MEYHQTLMKMVGCSMTKDLIRLIEEYWTDWFLLWSYGLTKEEGCRGQRDTRAHIRTQFRYETSEDVRLKLLPAPCWLVSPFVCSADAILTFLAASHPVRLTGEQLQEALMISESGIKNDRIRFPTLDISQSECSHHQWVKLFMSFHDAAIHLESFLSELIDLLCLDVDKSLTRSLVDDSDSFHRKGIRM